jgi:hypothetical protein
MAPGELIPYEWSRLDDDGVFSGRFECFDMSRVRHSTSFEIARDREEVVRLRWQGVDVDVQG